MSSAETSRVTAPGAIDPGRLVVAVSLALALGYVVFLGGAIANGDWFVDRAGRIIANDFVMVWSAARLVLEGRPADAYDMEIAKAVAVAGTGREFEGYFPFFYPPPYLAIVAPFGLLPLLPAMLAWIGVTGAGYVAVVRACLGGGFALGPALAIACGFPAALWNVAATQNGFLTTALFGTALLVLPTRPVWAGVLFGLMTYKPHFGILIPLVLVADRQWRAITAAAVTALALVGVAWIAFGPSVFTAFLTSTALAAKANIADGSAGWAKMQSVYGLLRVSGAGQTLAMSIQILLAAVIAAGLVFLWRSHRPYALKAAALVTGTLLATPYAFIYDDVLLAVPAALLLRLAREDGWPVVELAGLGVVAGLLLSFPWVPWQAGPAAALVIAALIVRRAFAPGSVDVNPPVGSP